MMHDEYLEKNALAGFMTNPKSLQYADGFEVSDFFTDHHRIIFTAIRKLIEQGMEVDWASVSQEIDRRKVSDSPSRAYLMDICELIPNRYDVRPSLDRLKELSQLRSIYTLASSAMQRAENGDLAEDILYDLQSSALKQQSESSQLRIMTAPEMALESLDSLRNRWNRHPDEMPGISTGIDALDEATSGWRDGELTYVGAMPGRGKTSFMVQCMYSALEAGVGVGCVSLEMRRGQLWDRLTILKSELDAYKFRDPRVMNTSEREHTKRSVISLGDLPYQCIDQSGLRPSQITTAARRMHSAGARIIFVDFVQIIQEDGKDRREAINRVSAALRDTCKALNIPFVVLSQLARRDSNPNRRPTIQDLRESGNLEQDAHNVFLLYRPKDESGAWTGIDEIIIDKQREGLTGSIPVSYESKTLTYKRR